MRQIDQGDSPLRRCRIWWCPICSITWMSSFVLPILNMFWICQHKSNPLFVVFKRANFITFSFIVICQPFVFAENAHVLGQIGIRSCLVSCLFHWSDHIPVQWKSWSIVFSMIIAVPVLLIVNVKCHDCSAQWDPFGIAQLNISIACNIDVFTLQQFEFTIDDNDTCIESQMFRPFFHVFIWNKMRWSRFGFMMPRSWSQIVSQLNSWRHILFHEQGSKIWDSFGPFLSSVFRRGAVLDWRFVHWQRVCGS